MPIHPVSNARWAVLIEEWASELFPNEVGSTAAQWRAFLDARCPTPANPNAPMGVQFDYWRKHALGPIRPS